MTFNIDLYLRTDRMGFRFEDTFRVTEEGGEAFTSVDRNLIEA